MQLVTGHTGADHVKSDQAGAMHAGLAGTGTYVLGTGSKLAATMLNANTVSIADGDLMLQGRHCSIAYGETDELTVQNGTQAQKRHDLVVARYEKLDTEPRTESVTLKVIKGTPSDGDAEDPGYEEGDILAGDLVAEVPLYRIPLDGITVGDPVPLFDVLVPMSELKGDLDELRDSVSQNVAALEATTNVRQDQTWSDIEVTAHERAGIVTVTVTRMGKSGTASVLNAQSTVGHIKAGHRPAVARRQLLGCKSSGEWLYMGVDASGTVFINTMYATGTTTWGSFSGTLSYPVP